MARTRAQLVREGRLASARTAPSSRSLGVARSLGFARLGFARSLGFALALCLTAASGAFAAPSASFSPYEDPGEVTLAALAGAQQRVDVAQYNIRNEVFADALRALKARGVQVRIVVDAKNAAEPWNTLDDDFEAEGFALKRYRNSGHAYAIMHHKFCVIDGRQVLTGSFNWNHTADLVNDENMVSLDDPGLVAAYETEFAELWGTQPEAPGVGQGTTGRVYFSPEDRPRDAILAAIRAAQRRILVAMFSFRDRDVANAMADAARRGVEVVLVTEKKQADGTREDERVASGGGRVIVAANDGATHSAMHHKFAVIDDEVLTGACNWTWTAFTHSNEDVLVLRDAGLVRRYTDAFAALVARYDAPRYLPSDFGVLKAEAGVNVLIRMANTGLGDRIVFVGADPALGGWDPALGVELETASGIFPTWSGRVRLPAGTRSACKAVLIRADGSVRWELDADRTLEIDTAGTDRVLDLSFRDEVEVSLEVEHPTLPVGRSLALLGAHDALGGWDERRALSLAPVLSQPGRYTLQVRLPGRTAQQCKLVEVTADGRVLYESGYDRILEVHDRVAPQAIAWAARGPAHDPSVASVASASTISAPAAPASASPAPASGSPSSPSPAAGGPSTGASGSPAVTSPAATSPAGASAAGSSSAGPGAPTASAGTAGTAGSAGSAGSSASGSPGGAPSTSP